MAGLSENASLASSSTPATPQLGNSNGITDAFVPGTENDTGSYPNTVPETPTPAPTHLGEEISDGRPVQLPRTVDVEAIIEEARATGVRKGRSAQEIDIMVQTAARVANQLAADHLAVLYPDVETPFSDAEDAVKRLLPYHTLLHPAEDLFSLANPGKGKGRASDNDDLLQEISETKFALECWKRRRILERRFRRARIQEGRRSAPDEMAYIIANSVLEADKAELNNLQAEYRTAKAQLDNIEREKKAAAAAASAPPKSSSYYPSATPSGTSSAYTSNTSTGYSSQYRGGYTYSYSQPYGSSYSHIPYNAYNATTASTSTPHSTASTTAQPQSTPTFSSTSQVSTGTTPTTPISVQIPVTSLGELTKLGITPIAAANAPPVGQPQPAVVLKGTTENGTKINLEINISALEAPQASGLAAMLSSLTS